MRLGRHRGKFCVVWYEEGKRQRRSLGTSDPSEARRLLAEFEALKQRSEQPTVGDIFLAYKERKDNVRIGYAWKSLEPHFAALWPHHITRADCIGYADVRMGQGASPGTVHTELLYLAAALNDAEKQGRIGKAPHIWKPRKPRPRDRRISRQEARNLIEAADMPHIKLAIRLMLGTAGRVGAILDLTWDRVDFERGLIRLDNPAREETAKRRAVVPMNEGLREALSEAHRGALTGHVIEWGGSPVRSIKKGFKSACVRAGLQDVTPHTLRHTAATWMAEAGVSMDEIAQYLGHSDARTTYRIYARFSPDYLRRASAALEV